jgi:hypothetical protein
MAHEVATSYFFNDAVFGCHVLALVADSSLHELACACLVDLLVLVLSSVLHVLVVIVVCIDAVGQFLDVGIALVVGDSRAAALLCHGHP